jgi:hypothetical protein
VSLHGNGTTEEQEEDAARPFGFDTTPSLLAEPQHPVAWCVDPARYARICAAID